MYAEGPGRCAKGTRVTLVGRRAETAFGARTPAGPFLLRRVIYRVNVGETYLAIVVNLSLSELASS